MYGHTDYGITTLLFSVPVTALHIWTRQDRWQAVKVSSRRAVHVASDLMSLCIGTKLT
jgi:isopenicillin N synthase-like dioxygenase